MMKLTVVLNKIKNKKKISAFCRKFFNTPVQESTYKYVLYSYVKIEKKNNKMYKTHVLQFY